MQTFNSVCCSGALPLRWWQRGECEQGVSGFLEAVGNGFVAQPPFADERLSPVGIWAAHGLKPHLTKTFKLSRDPNFVAKVEEIVGLYLNPPDKALVLAVDEKSHVWMAPSLQEKN